MWDLLWDSTKLVSCCWWSVQSTALIASIRNDSNTVTSRDSKRSITPAAMIRLWEWEYRMFRLSQEVQGWLHHRLSRLNWRLDGLMSQAAAPAAAPVVSHQGTVNCLWAACEVQVIGDINYGWSQAMDTFPRRHPTGQKPVRHAASLCMPAKKCKNVSNRGTGMV